MASSGMTASAKTSCHASGVSGNAIAATTLSFAVPGLAVQPDDKTGTLLLRGTQADILLAKSFLTKVDVPVPASKTVAAEEEVIDIIQLANAEAQGVYTAVSKLLKATLAVDTRLNAIRAGGNVSDVKAARLVIEKLDVPKKVETVAAAAGVVGLWFPYQAGAHGGQLVYSYAGGVGIRSGEPQDVGRLLLAGLAAFIAPFALPAALLVAAIAANAPLFALFARANGYAFALGAILFHQFHYLYASAAFVAFRLGWTPGGARPSRQTRTR